MALVVFLKGVNVGGHRSFRPSLLARQLARLDAVNIGTAGTFVIRGRVARSALRAELTRRLPFETHLAICDGREVLHLAAYAPFAGQRVTPHLVQFVSVLDRRRPSPTAMPFTLPSDGEWSVKVLGQQDRFVFGVYRRQMRTIRYLEQLDRIFGAPVTTRSWSSILAIVRVLDATNRHACA